MREIKYNNPTGKGIRVLTQPQLLKGENIIDFGTARILKSMGYSISEISIMLEVQVSAVLRWVQ